FLLVGSSIVNNKTTIFTPAPKNVPPGISKMVCRLQLSNKYLRNEIDALSVLLKNVFLITIPARPPAFRLLIKCCKNKKAVSLVLISKRSEEHTSELQS